VIEIRTHGRGGQGAVIASELLAFAFFKEGKQVQAFPTFGVERRGAPVMAFTRVDSRPIRLRNMIYEPDHLIILDPSLIEATNVTAGLKPGGTILVNSDRPESFFKLPSSFRCLTVDAAGIAVRHNLGSRTHPIVNTAVAGAFAAFTGLVGIESTKEAIMELVPSRQQDNAKAAEEAFHQVNAKLKNSGRRETV